MWSWFNSLFKQSSANTSKKKPLSKKQNQPDLSPELSEKIDLRNQINALFYQYLLDSEPSEFESQTGKQIYSKLSKAFTKPEIDTSTLPRKPSALPMLIRMLNDDSSDIRSVTSSILSDPNLTGKIIQVANSPLFHTRPDPIESIDQAIFILGKDGIRNLVSTSLFSPMMTSKTKHHETFSKKAWQWALTCAATSECIARYSGLNPSKHYLWGLFPPLADLLIYQEVCAHYKKMNSEYEPESGIAEKLLNKYSWHFCGQLAKSWHLPKQNIQFFNEMSEPAHYKIEHYPLADAITLSQATILHKHHRDSFDMASLENAFFSSSKVIKKAGLVCEEKVNNF